MRKRNLALGQRRRRRGQVRQGLCAASCSHNGPGTCGFSPQSRPEAEKEGLKKATSSSEGFQESELVKMETDSTYQSVRERRKRR